MTVGLSQVTVSTYLLVTPVQLSSIAYVYLPNE